MTNNYEIATAVELGNVQDMVLGEKTLRLAIDCMTLEFGTYWDWILDDNE